jgi:hypothetical protein
MGAFQEFWFDHSNGADAAPVPYYPHLVTWAQDMQDTTKKYSALFLQGLAIFKEIQKLKDERNHSKP